jgi:hypothetical protein
MRSAGRISNFEKRTRSSPFIEHLRAKGNAMKLKKILCLTAVVGAFSLLASHNRAQAISLINPSAIAEAKMTTQVQWRHRHHQLRRQSRRHPHHGGDSDKHS